MQIRQRESLEQPVPPFLRIPTKPFEHLRLIPRQRNNVYLNIRTMKLIRFLSALALFGSLLLALSGCGTLNEDENMSNIPHARPANWEGTVPGMPGSR